MEKITSTTEETIKSPNIAKPTDTVVPENNVVIIDDEESREENVIPEKEEETEKHDCDVVMREEEEKKGTEELEEENKPTTGGEEDKKIEEVSVLISTDTFEPEVEVIKRRLDVGSSSQRFLRNFITSPLTIQPVTILLKELEEKRKIIEETVSALHALVLTCTVDSSCSIREKCKLLVDDIKDLTTSVDERIRSREEETKHSFLQQLQEKYHESFSELKKLLLEGQNCLRMATNCIAIRCNG